MATGETKRSEEAVSVTTQMTGAPAEIRELIERKVRGVQI
jgi:hypothetical protein